MSPRSARQWVWSVALLLVTVSLTALGARVSDVASTKHNLSTSGPGPVRAVSESQICVFCHTPHGAETQPGLPLWNRQLSNQTYSTYLSNSIQANVAELAAGPGGTSKLCLSCHDGAMSISAVNVANGQLNPTIAMQGTGPGDTMPAGAGAQTGFTRNLGTDLTNDHPISFTYDSALALADGELRDPTIPPASNYIGTHGDKTKKIPLENGEVECASCHDPHIREDPDPGYSIKFLRLNRFQITPPTGSAFSESGDIICLACHDKLGTAWSQSAHATSTAADEIYRSGPGSPAELREFPTGIRVWEAACLNCHDTHTVQGARRLLREGTDALGTPKSGGTTAIEQVCYQCHTTAAQSILTDSTNVPNIQSDFEQSPGTHMPISNADQQTGGEIHDITDADFSESRTLLGLGNPLNRHVECTDCHNPHRVLKNQLFNATGNTTEGTHPHTTGHTNIASGVLRGAWGVEPQYGGVSFFDMPTGYAVKSGDPGASTSTAVGQTYVTREYQICLKCHSDYGYSDNNVYPTGTRPNLGASGGGTTAGTNGLNQYTNQAREIQAPSGHRGEGTATGGSGGWATTYNTNNHRSWHPVLDITGRNNTTRNTVTGSWEAPWANNVGNQTMYCSDCHGSNTGAATSAPTGSNPWGPHGSSNNFILKGTWSGTANDLCFKCHDQNTYSSTNDTGSSGFCCDGRGNLHNYHRSQMGAIRCMWCHVAVPHGWKNKALLVNLNDVGPEAGRTVGTEIQMIFTESDVRSYSQEPYYFRSRLKILNFRTSGNWTADSCGSQALDFERGDPGRGISRGRNWMRDACQAASP